jgi:antirestriction protein ArdC
LTPEVRDDHASYIASWIEVLKNDKRCVVQAASYAQKAVDYLHGLQPSDERVPAEEGATASTVLAISPDTPPTLCA